MHVSTFFLERTNTQFFLANQISASFRRLVLWAPLSPHSLHVRDERRSYRSEQLRMPVEGSERRLKQVGMKDD